MSAPATCKAYQPAPVNDLSKKHTYLATAVVTIKRPRSEYIEGFKNVIIYADYFEEALQLIRKHVMSNVPAADRQDLSIGIAIDVRSITRVEVPTCNVTPRDCYEGVCN